MARRTNKYGRGRGSRYNSGQGDSLPVKIANLWNDLKTMLAMLIDVVFGRYRPVPLKTILAMLGAFLYFFSPIDLLPDFIPFFGYLDDAFVIVLAIDLVRDDLAIYRAWKEQGEQ